MRPLIVALVILAGGLPAHADVTGNARRRYPETDADAMKKVVELV